MLLHGSLMFVCLQLGIARWFVQADLVLIKPGVVNGTTKITNTGVEFKVYLGIPYAKSPLGNLRFKPPVISPPWEGILDATKEPKICVQLLPDIKIPVGYEDCLTLNVYAPLHSKPGDNIPVIVYIYGGIFKQGSNIHNGPQKFMNKRVILVIPNYRMGPLGFLSTGDTVISGNMGLKDQTLALKWVNENIYAFGGNPNLITIHGHSSGAMSVHLHMLSPSSVGLFNRVIIQSGTSFSSTSFFSKDIARLISQKLAKHVGCNGTSSREMLNCFMQLDPKILFLQQDNLTLWNGNPDGIFRPTVEDENADEAFLTDVPIKCSYQSMDKEMLIGVTSGEGAIYTSGLLSDGGNTVKVFNDQYKILFPITLQYLWNTKPKHRDYISLVTRRHYFGNEEINEQTAYAITQMYSQGLFIASTNEAIRRYEGTKYVYLFDYVSGYTVNTEIKTNNGHFYGIGHAEELPLFFVQSDAEIYLTEEDKIFGDEMITRWVNFVYSGNPNVPYPINTDLFGEWDPTVSETVEFLQLKINGTMKQDYYTSEYKFWRSLPTFSKFF